MFRRLFNTLLAIWLVVVVGDSGVLHACPEHGAHGGHGAVSSHTSHQAAGARNDGHENPLAGCTCIGSCCAAPMFTPVSVGATFTVSAKLVSPLAQPEFSDDAPLASPDRLLPLGNGPPQG